MATIGKVVISIEAQSAAFTKGVEKAGKDADGLKGKLTDLGSFNLDLGSLVSVAAFTEIASTAAEAVAKIGEAFAAAGEKVTEWVAESLAAANASVALASALGYSTETIGALTAEAKALGGGAEGVQTGLAKLTKEIGEAATKGGEGAEAFARLGLSAQALAGMTGDQQIRAVADAIAAIPNHAEQAAAAVQLFGRSGAALLPLFAGGAKGIDEAVAKGLKLGDVLTTFDSSRLAAAARAADDVGRSFDGVKNSLAIALAPAITDISKAIIDVLPSADAFRSGFTSAFTAVVEAGAKVLDVWAAIEAPAMRVEAVYLRVAAALARIQAVTVQLQADAIAWVSRLPVIGTVVTTIADVVVGMGRAIVASVEWVWTTIERTAALIDRVLQRVHLSNPSASLAGGAADTLGNAATLVQHAADALDKTSFSDKAHQWLAKIGADSTAAANQVAAGVGSATGVLSDSVADNAKKIEDALQRLREEAEKATGTAVVPVVDLTSLQGARQQLADLHASALATVRDLATQFGKLGATNIMPRMESLGMTGELMESAAAQRQVTEAQQQQAEAAAEVRRQLQAANANPAKLVAVDDLQAANAALEQARAKARQAADAGTALAQSFDHVRSVAADTPAAKLIDVEALHNAVATIDAANADVAAAQARQQSAADRLRTSFPDKPAALVDLSNLDKANAAVAQARSRADEATKAVQAQYKALRDTVAQRDPAKLVDVDNLGRALDGMRALAVADAAAYAAAQAKVEQLRSTAQNWGKPHELVDLANLGASKQQLEEAAALLDQITRRKIGDELDKLAKQVATFGQSEAQKAVASLTDKGANADEIARAKLLADQLDTLQKQKAVSDDIGKLQREAAQFGMTDAQRKLADLRDKGATDDQLKQAQQLQESIDRMKQWQDDQRDANKLIEESATPIAKYQKKLDDLQRLFAEGLITSQQQADAIDRANRDLAKADHDSGEPKHAEAVTRRFDFTLPKEPPHKDTAADQLNVSKQHLDATKQSLNIQQQQWTLEQQQAQDAAETVEI